MSLGVGASTLNDARKALNARWDELRRQWDDAAAAKFEQDFIQVSYDGISRVIMSNVQLEFR